MFGVSQRGLAHGGVAGHGCARSMARRGASRFRRVGTASGVSRTAFASHHLSYLEALADALTEAGMAPCTVSGPK